MYYEELACLDDALAREKQIKSYRREKKNRLIELVNPDWNDLYASVLGSLVGDPSSLRSFGTRRWRESIDASASIDSRQRLINPGEPWFGMT